METATRYLATIESLMVENSRLSKELEDAVKGKLPSRIISQEEADKCFHMISKYLGPVAKGTLLSEITVLCDEFQKVGTEYMKLIPQIKALEKETQSINQAVKGNDVEQGYTTPLITKVVRLHAVLEVIKARLDRMCSSSRQDMSEIYDLRKDVAGFLNGDKNE